MSCYNFIIVFQCFSHSPLQGPLSSSDLGNRERLDRPVIKMFQRHPGTNLPEAQEIVKVFYIKTYQTVLGKTGCLLKYSI